MVGDNKAMDIAELVGMMPVSQGRPEIAFFNPGKDKAMKLAHRRTCHTAVTTLKKMMETKAVHGLDELSSSMNGCRICEACVEGKATNAIHKPREKILNISLS